MDETGVHERAEAETGSPPFSEEIGLPPLRLHHFFAFTAASALLLSTFGPSINAVSSVEAIGRYWLLLAIAGTIYSLLVAFAITVTAYGVAWHRKGIRYPRYPGHWLLVAITVSYILSFVLASILPNSVYPGEWLMWAWKLPIACVDIWIGRIKCEERRWRWTFYLRGFAALMPILGDLPLLVMISRANLIDRRLGVRRDVLHRCGVTIQILQSLLVVGFFFFIMVAFFIR